MKNKLLNLIPVLCFLAVVIFLSLAFMPDNTPAPEPTPPPDYCTLIQTISTGSTTKVYKISDNGSILYVVINDKTGSVAISR